MPVWQCPASTALLLADVSWLMPGLSGVSGLATQLIHNPDKPSAVDWEATIAGPALRQGGCIKPREFPDNVFYNFFSQCCIFWLALYLFSKLKLFLISLLTLDRAFIPRNCSIFPVFFSSSF